ncbi:MAG: hypothetical protein KIT33_10550 [Candidatus Kapabacteria bacterium]|nr:hypothetical protein [Ignavibacteriota bacterium]MCW5885399.1 hypothetical protein [Candidatus Kapabacteria bacterium]
MRIIIITGNKSAGKTTLVGSLISRAEQSNLNFDGIISRAVFDFKGEKTGFESVRLSDKKTELLCHSGLVAKTSTFKYGFSAQAFSLGESFTGDNFPETFFLDEVGILEADNQGWSELLRRLLKSNVKVLVLSLRLSVLDKIIELYQFHNSIVYKIDSENEIAKLTDEISAQISID